MDTVTDPETWTHGGGLVAVLAAVALVLAVTLYRARRRGRVDRWVSTVAGVAVLGLSAEGMWMVAVHRLGLPPVLAVVTFAVFELAMLSSAMHATTHYRRTTVRDAAGAIVTPGHPGRHGTVVWVIAGTAGVIVSLNSQSFVEVLLRLALPLMAAGMWHTTLTAEGVSRPAGSWRWTPRRLLVRLGAIEPTERDLSEVARDRRIHAMTATARRVHRGAWPQRIHAARLGRLALYADDAMIEAVRERITRAHRAVELTAPVAPAPVAADAAVAAPPAARAVVGRGASDGSARRQRARRTRPASRESDAALLARYGDQLTAEAAANGGRITRYRVQQVCDIGARPAQRIRATIQAVAASQPPVTTTPEDHEIPGQTAITMDADTREHTRTAA
ncbi:hypothetical protein E1262_27280 [Jiangella aurantiaca]|uniref:DUF2637 domain-containing protein n=1 Tax=Jiangella aurantiaca TaxID=2530373 RepID=A0A4R4ZZH4_9ACTN|nr:hypothetical protein [Jiangella aurantiaca]TDD64793.1 hypothetical protein E1262_27280 [Jiangella aurantiaca]